MHFVSLPQHPYVLFDPPIQTPKYMRMIENKPKGLELFIKVDWFVFTIFNAIWGGGWVTSASGGGG